MCTRRVLICSATLQDLDAIDDAANAYWESEGVHARPPAQLGVGVSLPDGGHMPPAVHWNAGGGYGGDVGGPNRCPALHGAHGASAGDNQWPASVLGDAQHGARAVIAPASGPDEAAAIDLIHVSHNPQCRTDATTRLAGQPERGHFTQRPAGSAAAAAQPLPDGPDRACRQPPPHSALPTWSLHQLQDADLEAVRVVPPRNPQEAAHLPNQAAIRHWVYPADRPVRGYQYSMALQATLRNTLVCLPTGLGKTMIATVVRPPSLLPWSVHALLRLFVAAAVLNLWLLLRGGAGGVLVQASHSMLMLPPRSSSLRLTAVAWEGLPCHWGRTAVMAQMLWAYPSSSSSRSSSTPAATQQKQQQEQQHPSSNPAAAAAGDVSIDG
jgi:hypothetical protein